MRSVGLNTSYTYTKYVKPAGKFGATKIGGEEGEEGEEGEDREEGEEGDEQDSDNDRSTVSNGDSSSSS